MNAEKPNGPGAEMLDDFFAEADEHLLGIRKALNQLESSANRNHADPKIIEELFRHFHSFKGISAIVGLAPAEAVSHAIEDYLRMLRSGKLQLTPQSSEVLIKGTRKLEQIVAAFRSRKPLPGYKSVLDDLKAQCELAPDSSGPAQSSESTTPQGSVTAKIEEARARGLLLWKFKFTPSHELNAQNININTIREQVGKVGEVLKSYPLVQSGGALTFEFLVAAKEGPGEIAAWEAKGVTIQPAEQEDQTGNPLLPAEHAGIEEESHSPFLAPSHVVRIDLKQLDNLMRITGEMVIHRSRLDTELSRLNRNGGKADLRAVQEVSGGLGRSLRDLREAITRARLVPVAEIFARMPFVVRDLESQTQKKVRLKLEGQETSIDKYLIERLKDPLLHLVRNAFSHGVETRAERTTVSKPEEANIELKASTVGDSVVIQVSDDGRGINPNAILRQARKMGLEIPPVVDNASILRILCSPGFSIREDADRVAGRGVGMAVVYTTVRELGGTLSMESDEGRGTKFTLRLPLTLAIAEMFIVRAAGQTCAVPQNFVREILQTSESQIQIANGIEVIDYRTGVLPVVRLAGLFRSKSPEKPKMYMLVISSERGSVGLLVEEILGQREVVVRALSDPLIQVEGIAGATELGDDKPVLILDGSALTAGSVRPQDSFADADQPNRFEPQPAL